MTQRAWIGTLAVVLIAGAALADRFKPPGPPVPAADVAAEPGGVWVCPVVKLPGAQGYLHLVNTGRAATRVRIAYIVESGKPLEQAISLGSRRSVTVAAPRQLLTRGAGAIVEYAGGQLTVSRTVFIGGVGTLAAGAASCSRPGGVVQVVPQGSTLRAETQLVLLNPGRSDAVTDIAILVGGQRVRPVSLQGRVVPAGRRLIVRLGDFAFDARSIAASITSQTGRIVADGVVVTPSYVDLVPGQNATRDLVAVASAARGPATFSSIAIGDDDAVITAGVLSEGGRTAYGPLVPALAPNTPQVSTLLADEVPEGAVALSTVSKTAPIAIGSRWAVRATNGRTDSAVSSGAQPANEVVAVIGPPALPGALRLLVANPDVSEAVLGVIVITEAGATEPPRLQDVHLGPGRATTLSFQDLPKTGTVGVVVSSVGARIAAALEAVTTRPGAFAAYAATGVPLLPASPVAVEPDPRQGVPAR
jgi:hypothetical protein